MTFWLRILMPAPSGNGGIGEDGMSICWTNVAVVLGGVDGDPEPVGQGDPRAVAR